MLLACLATLLWRRIRGSWSSSEVVHLLRSIEAVTRLIA